MFLVDFFVPVKTISTPNVREHWAVRAKRAKSQRSVARTKTAEAMRGVKLASAIVLLNRFGARKLDSDNLPAALKSVRDGVADAIGIDDGDDAVVYEYGQFADRNMPRGVQVIIRSKT
jgi:hypothetical protein